MSAVETQLPRKRVEVAHGQVAGRTRLRVRGLWRDAAGAEELEHAIRVQPWATAVSADARTGRVLVRHSAGLAAAEVACRVESLLAGRAPASSRPVPRDVPPWHALSVEQLLAALAVDPERGLSEASAADRYVEHGPNRLSVPEPPGELRLFLDQLASLPVALLSGSAALSLVTRAFFDAAVTVAVVATNAVIGYLTESGTQRLIRQLTRAEDLDARVIRSRVTRLMSASGLVRGDVIELRRGDPVPADARILQASGLTVDESALTGESLPRRKRADAELLSATPLGDRVNMLYLGTTIVGGSARAVVTATGDVSEIGQVQALAGATEAPGTPMERDLDRLGREVALGALAICGVAFGVGLLRGHGMLQMLKSAVALAVAAVPEGLPTVATSTLALGLRRMRRQSLLVRHLDAVEALGSVQVLCLDKTGTLTLNRMQVTAAAAGRAQWSPVDDRERAPVGPAEALALCRLAEVAMLALEKAPAGNGLNNAESGTERAIVEFARDAGLDLDALVARFRRLECRLREQDHNFVAVRHADAAGGEILAMKGRPVEVLDRCERVLCAAGTETLTAERRAELLLENERLAASGLRVLAVAYREHSVSVSLHDHGLVWVGLIGMSDPVRPGVAATIAKLQAAGIRTVMITGDQGATAVKVADTLNLSGGLPLRVLDAESLEGMDPEMLVALADQTHVFARISPAKKLEIVQALQRAGRIVAMTGDGINDGPALKAADIGIAMGRDGTRVARDVADLLIEDDDLDHVVTGVREGRSILSNIRKSIHFLLSTNLSEILVVFVEILRGPRELESPMELFWINLVTDVLPGLGLALEPAEPGVMERPPRPSDEPLVGASYYRRLGVEAGIIGGSALAAHFYGIARYGAGPRTRTLTFLSLVSAQLLHALSCRSDRFEEGGLRGILEDRPLLGALGLSAALQALPFLVPPLGRLLGLVRPGLGDLAVVACAAGASFSLNELLLAATQAKPEDNAREHA